MMRIVKQFLFKKSQIHSIDVYGATGFDRLWDWGIFLRWHAQSAGVL